MGRILSAGAALFTEGAQQHPELVSRWFGLDQDGAAQRIQARATVPLQWLDVMPAAVMPCLLRLVNF